MSVVTVDMLEPIVVPTFPLFPLFWMVAAKYYFLGRKVISTVKKKVLWLRRPVIFLTLCCDVGSSDIRIG